MRKLIGRIILWFIKGSYKKKEDYYQMLIGFFTDSIQDELDQLKRGWYGSYRDRKTKEMVEDTIEKIVKDLKDLINRCHEQEEKIITSGYKANLDELQFMINKFKQDLKQEEVIDDIVDRIKKKQLL